MFPVVGDASPARLARPRAGFTLIELLIVVVIVGILAAIAIPKYQRTKDVAAKGSMKSDLRNLAVAQESYFSTRHKYAETIDSLNYTSSSGIDVEIVEADGKGWSATAKRTGYSASECGLFHGTAAPVPPATVQSIIGCID